MGDFFSHKTRQKKPASCLVHQAHVLVPHYHPGNIPPCVSWAHRRITTSGEPPATAKRNGCLLPRALAAFFSLLLNSDDQHISIKSEAQPSLPTSYSTTDQRHLHCWAAVCMAYSVLLELTFLASSARCADSYLSSEYEMVLL